MTAGEPRPAIRVVIVDDHALVRAGLAAVLANAADVEVVGDAADGAAAVEVVRATRPDIVLMDLSMPGTDGTTAIRALRAADAPGRVVVLTSFDDAHRVRAALDAGAVGYLLKDSEPDRLLDAVRTAHRGEVPIDPRVAGVLLPAMPLRARGDSDAGGPSRGGAGSAYGLSGLSEREREVLVLVAGGLANKQIGHRLGISERTVKAHLGSIFRQIGVGDRTRAALWARDHGMTDPI